LAEAEYQPLWLIGRNVMQSTGWLDQYPLIITPEIIFLKKRPHMFSYPNLRKQPKEGLNVFKNPGRLSDSSAFIT